MWMRAAMALAALGGWSLTAQAPEKAGVADRPVVEVEGRIAGVGVARGRGMPFIEVRRGDETLKVRLGSMRYLMEQDFRPKAGSEVKVKGFDLGGEMVAITVETAGKTIRLRDEKGWPLWSGRRRGRGGR
jgi:hypothetical protein